MGKHIKDCVNDGEYMSVVKRMRPTVRSIRRRALISTLHRWHQESGFGPVTYVEVGVKYGSLTHCILEWCPFIEKAIGIDPYAEYPPDHRDRGQFGYANREQGSWDHLYKRAQQILGKWGDRVELWREFSADAAAKCANQGRQFEVVYLDAMHAYDDVLADARAWWPLVKPGGMLLGDDYYGPVGAEPKNWRRTTTGVSDAVDAFAAEVGLPLVGLHRSWYVQKV